MENSKAACVFQAFSIENYTISKVLYGIPQLPVFFFGGIRTMKSIIALFSTMALCCCICGSLGAEENKFAEIDELNFAIADGDYDLVEELLDNGTKINSFNEVGLTPLVYAVETYSGDDEILRLLLSRGANVNIRMPRNGKTAFVKALERPDTLDVAMLMLEKGADVNNEDRQGVTALWTALGLLQMEDVEREQAMALIEAMLKKSADPNKPIKGGTTPLMLAAISDDTELVQLLLDNQADIEIKNESGLTALDLAKEKQNKETVELLESARPTDDPPAAEPTAEPVG